MIIGELNYQIDKVWEVFWIGGISNPLTVIGPMTHLLFTSKLNELKPMKMQILKYIN
jgi:type I restriction enzyme M protein